jgi:hypothetical protein
MPFCRCFYQYGYPEFLMPTSLSAAQNLQEQYAQAMYTYITRTDHITGARGMFFRERRWRPAQTLPRRSARRSSATSACLLVAAHAQPPSTGHIKWLLLQDRQGYTTTTPIPGPVSCCSVPGAPRATATCDAMKDFSCHRNVGGDAQHMHMHMRDPV